MQSVAGIAELHMAGTRATFTLRRGATLERGELADAFAERKMKLESLEVVRRPRAKEVYLVGAGIG